MSWSTVLSNKATWATIVGIIAGIAGIFGYTFSAADQETLTTIGASIAGGLVSAGVIYKKVKATKKDVDTSKTTNDAS